ncbi:hypothetical protein LTS08_007578 [Lithohypha guttulata]|nr:hypothetical protein LTS08_007578 [Lithohypha guttulata]
MRLQITVHRHTLAPVRNVFNTNAQQLVAAGYKILTVSDLLSAVNYLIPIESDHWGCEDYAVESRLNDNQSQFYEVFHWQSVDDVFKEDDEVVIRPLVRKEIKERRYNGRHQINQSGVHMIDGGPWGRGVIVRNRPRVYIPPRGGTDEQLAIAETQEEENQDDQERESQLMITNVLGLDNDEEEADDEEDYEDDASNASTEDSLEHEAEDEEDGLETQDTIDVGGKILKEIVFDENGEKQLLEEKPPEQSPAGKKRKRVQILDGHSKTVRAPEPTKRRKIDIAEDDSSSRGPIPESQEAGLTNGTSSTIIVNGVGSEHEDDSSSSSGSEDSDESDSSSEGSADVPVGNAHITTTTPAATVDTSSSGSDMSDTDSSDSSSDSSDSDESSTSGESSSSGEEVVESALPETKDLKGPEHYTEQVQHEVAYVEAQKPAEKQNVPPGKGSLKTQKNNIRKKQNKILSRLKAEGELPPGANFESLEAYLRRGDATKFASAPTKRTQEAGTEAEEIMVNGTEDIAEEVAARREELLRRLNGNAPQLPTVEQDVEITEVSGTNVSEQDPPAEPVSELAAAAPFLDEEPVQPEAVLAEPVIAAEPAAQEIAAEEPSLKRVRLDVASSRRMLFNALGVRNPKTPAAEQALREKLAKPVRQVKEKEILQSQSTGPTPAAAPTAQHPERWKSKLIIKAVECVQTYKKPEVPPFPFKHPWQVRKEKEEARQNRKQQQKHDNQSYRYEDQQLDPPEEQAREEDDDQDIELDYGDAPSQALTTSRTLTAETNNEEDIIPIPSDFDALYDFEPHDLVKGAVIAYKQLHLDEHFQPGQSPYRVARILSNEGPRLRLRLAPQYRDSETAQYDEETGDRVYNKFEMPIDDEDEPDDGLREIAFDEMIQPKFVAPSDSAGVVIAHSQSRSKGPQAELTIHDQTTTSLQGGDAENSGTSRVEETQQQVSTPRRTEIEDIIKDAGFDSALDAQILRPLPESTVSNRGLPETSTEQAHAWRLDADAITSPTHPFVPSAERESSPPSESMVESVRYPNLSQLGLETPSVPAQSSSHQDAQRMTPTPMPTVETSALLDPVQEDELDPDIDTSKAIDLPASLPSEVPQTQYPESLPAPTSPIPDQAEVQARSSPFANLDASNSPLLLSPKPSDGESVDSNGLPSLRALTSSQTQRRRQSSIFKVKPEPIRRSPRVNKSTETLYSSDPESPPLAIKSSASQKQPRLSQIPEDKAIVDLTQSSSPQRSSPKDRGGSGRGVGVGGKKVVSSSQQQGINPFKKSFEGLGEKSLLKRRKKRSL